MSNEEFRGDDASIRELIEGKESELTDAPANVEAGDPPADEVTHGPAALTGDPTAPPESDDEIRASLEAKERELSEREAELKRQEQRVAMAAKLGVAAGQLPDNLDELGDLTAATGNWWQIYYEPQKTMQRVIPRPYMLAQKKRRPVNDFEALALYHGHMGIVGSQHKPHIHTIDLDKAVDELMKEPEFDGRPEVEAATDDTGQVVPGKFIVSAKECPSMVVESDSEKGAVKQFLQALME